jgi:hypothetical protein
MSPPAAVAAAAAATTNAHHRNAAIDLRRLACLPLSASLYTTLPYRLALYQRLEGTEGVVGVRRRGVGEGGVIIAARRRRTRPRPAEKEARGRGDVTCPGGQAGSQWHTVSWPPGPGRPSTTSSPAAAGKTYKQACSAVSAPVKRTGGWCTSSPLICLSARRRAWIRNMDGAAKNAIR